MAATTVPVSPAFPHKETGDELRASEVELLRAAINDHAERLDALAPSYLTLLASDAVAVDLSKPAQLVSLSGNATFSTSARAQGRAVRLFLANPTGADVTLSFPAGWLWLGTVPTKLAAGKHAVLTLECVYGAAESDLVAGYAAQS